MTHTHMNCTLNAGARYSPCASSIMNSAFIATPVSKSADAARRLQANSSFYASNSMALVKEDKKTICDDFCSSEAVRPNDDAYYAS